MPTVKALFRKVVFQQPMQPVRSLDVLPEMGIAGDVNAIPYSPRQVLITSAAVLQEFGLSPGALRENIVVDGLDVDGLCSGTVLQFGNSARIRLTFTCEPCKRISSLFSVPISVINGRRGMLGAVVAAGELVEGDQVEVTRESYPEIPETKFERFIWILRRIPPGKVVTFAHLGVLLGVPSQYLRVIPKFVKRAALMNLPAYRVVTSNSCIAAHVADQLALLRNEGVEARDHVIDRRYHWVNSARPYMEPCTLMGITLPNDGARS